MFFLRCFFLMMLILSFYSCKNKEKDVYTKVIDVDVDVPTISSLDAGDVLDIKILEDENGFIFQHKKLSFNDIHKLISFLDKGRLKNNLDF